jgi:hypothetical protein
MADYNFQDLVVLSTDSLYHEGAQLQIGGSTASTVTFAFSNSAGQLALIATQTGNFTITMPNGGQIVTNVNVSAGTTSQNLSNVVFSNSNNISFGLNGSTITASATVASTQASINFSAGATSQNLSAITFANSNGISFGLNGSTMTASVATSLTAINVSASATSLNLSAITFSNSNNLTFGLSANSVITASGPISISAGTTSANLTNLTFSNSNNVSFGLNGSVITATATVATSLTNINVSAGTTSQNLSAITFSNGGGVTFGLNGSVLTASAALTTASAIGVSAGTSSANLSAVTFSNSNGHSFGLNGSTITVQNGGISSFQPGPVVGSFGSSNAFLSLQPFYLPYAITVTNLVWLMHISGAAASSAGQSFSAGFYTLTGGVTGTLSLLSSFSTTQSYTSGAALSSFSGTQYRSMTIGSLALTPGPYVLGFWGQSTNAGTMTFWGSASNVSFASGLGASIPNIGPLPGFSASSVAAMPSSIAIANTSGYVRTGSSVNQQPWFMLQGT